MNSPDFMRYSDLSSDVREAVDLRDRYMSDALNMLLTRLSAQTATWDSLDNKATGLLGLSVAAASIFVGAMVANGDTSWIEWSTLLVSSCFFALLGWEAWRVLQPRRIHLPPDPSAVFEQAEVAGVLRSWATAVGEAIALNGPIIEEKANRVSRMIRLLTSQAAVMIVGALSGAVL